MEPYVDAVTVMHILFVRECGGARVTAMVVWGWRRCGCGECKTCGWYM